MLIIGACGSSFTFDGLDAGKHRVLVVTSAGGSRTETHFYTCRKSIILLHSNDIMVA